MAREKTLNIRWKSQPRQMKFLRACGLSHAIEGGEPKKPVAKFIGYGGAAGGGKSDALLVAGIIYCLTYPRAKVGFFRRRFTQLEGSGGAIMRSRELLGGIAKYNEKNHRWTFPNGSILTFCYCDKEGDVQNYQSSMFDVTLWDEATHFTWSMISYIALSRSRSVRGYPTFAALATNPGGVGHQWFKQHFVKSGTPENVRVIELEPGKKRSVIFIPAKLSDNLILEKMDPDYRRNLEAMPEHLRKQLLEGDWDTAEGMAFTEWREGIHVCDPFHIPDEWTRFRALDWGYAKPYSVGWYAVDYDGRMYKYRELYGYGGRDDVGSKEDPADVAKKIIEMETKPDGTKEYIRYAVADDAIFGGRQDNSPSVAEQFNTAFGSNAVHWQPVGKGPRSRIYGKVEVHHRLKWEKDADGNWTGEPPMLVFFNTCRHTIRTLPNMVLDDNNPEDVDTTLEDHAYDETRYACQSYPITPRKPKEEETRIQKHKKRIAQQGQQNRYRVV
jgi:hypothetical protein